ncbi:hypothetical protein [Ralstonia sp. UBA689]|uniref:hypothetical protein n=1 Tax=Ralstonia sp. UBA689 TaxID=1947373 RepID=UPI0025D2D556|nr:hypothetical protein [Ralstonia sp. UBA689]
MKMTNFVARSLLISATVMAVLPAAYAAIIIRNAYLDAKPTDQGFTVGGATIAARSRPVMSST